MAGLLDYLDWRGDIPILCDSFNEVDNLVLSQLSYIDFEGIVPGNFKDTPVTVKQASEIFFDSGLYLERSSVGPMMSEQILFMLKKIRHIPRFSGMKMTGYVNHVDRERETQFAAVTTLMPDGTIYVAFRGTDNNIIGWKEDFNMSFLTCVPAQEMALSYLKQAAVLPGRIRVGGHSKGGNLAVYASVFSGEEVQRRIVGVYNNDGPGFMEDTVKGAPFGGFKDRIHTIVPKSSIVGMLLGHGEDYEVVDSMHSGIFQHDPFSWQVLGPSFIHLDGVTDGSRFADRTLREWIGAMDVNERKRFVDGLFEIIDAAECTKLTELSEDRLGKAIKIAKSWKNFDEDTKKTIQRTVQLLFQMARRNLRQR